MNPQAIEAQPTILNPPLALGIPGNLVFDDNPLDPLLYGTEPIAPTPASVLELWERGLDRSESCAHAVASVLVQCPHAINNLRDLDAAEQCLRQAIESKSAQRGAPLIACWGGLGRILELKNQKDAAERCYRQALELQKNAPDAKPEAASQIVFHLIQLLETSGRQAEAKLLRNRLRADSLSNKEDDTSLSQLRATALDMFLAGQYAEAEAVYRHLVEKRFELGSTHCHLARALLMMDRDAEAGREVEQAWAAHVPTPDYLHVRIQFLRALFRMLAGEEWKDCLVGFRDALAKPGAHADWTMQPVLDHLQPRLGSEQFELLTAMIAAVCQQPKFSELEANPLWREICRGDEADATAAREGVSSPA